MQPGLAGLRRSLAKIEGAYGSAGNRPFRLGVPEVDTALGGGLPWGALHEVFAGAEGDAASASGFALGLMLRGVRPGRRIVWIRQDMAGREYGELSPLGMAEFGADPGNMLVVRVRDGVGALRAAADALHCAELGGVVLEPYGGSGALDLTASRRLHFAAARSGVGVVAVRLGSARMQNSAAFSRWRVAGAGSRRLAANAPGLPAFRIDLLRHRGGCPPHQWTVEWDRESHAFRPSSLPRFVAATPQNGPAQAPAAEIWRRAG